MVVGRVEVEVMEGYVLGIANDDDGPNDGGNAGPNVDADVDANNVDPDEP